MKKICTNKSDIYAIYGCIFFIISIVGLLITLSILAEDNDYGKNALISLSIFIIVSIILTILCSELHLKKYGKYIEINDKCLVYNEEINIPIFLIKKIEYKKEKDQPRTLYFYMVNDNIEKFTFTKKVVKEIENSVNIPIEYNLKLPKTPLKQKWKNFINKIKKLVKENYIIIIFTTIGLAITITSFIIHVKHQQNTIINIILVLISLTFGTTQFYYAYFIEKEYDKFTRIIMSLFVSILFIIIVSLLILLFVCLVLKLEATIFVLLWATFLLPSFLIVVGIIMLILVGLSYA